MVDDRPGPWSTNLVDDKPDANQPPLGGLPFDERAALEELEHFRREIERYQALRHGVTHEFEHFVQSFKHPDPTRAVPPAYAAPPPTPVTAPKPAPLAEPFIAPAPITAPARVAEPAPARPSAPPVAAKPLAPPTEFQPSQRIESPRAERMEAVPAPAPIPVPRKKLVARGSIPMTWIAAASALVILAIGGYAWMQSGDSGNAGTSTDTTPPQQTATAPAPPPSTQAVPVNPAPPPATKPSPFESELTTTAAVWVRLIVDGERVFERELPAGHRVPITARESIVIRAGNPGAVRLTIGGVDQGVLGPEGFPLTRRFTVPR